jgi:hypothetical protein
LAFSSNLNPEGKDDDGGVMKLNDKHGMNKRSLAEEADKFTLV